MQTLNAQRMPAPMMKKVVVTALVAAAVVATAGNARAESYSQPPPVAPCRPRCTWISRSSFQKFSSCRLAPAPWPPR